jgi:Concanavalin A-like lectin/glucanases superfamily/PEP-CTERM motif
MNKAPLVLLSFAAASACGISHGATTLTNHVLIRFDGSLAGTAYSLGAGETDTTGTFKANGTPTLSGGAASLDGGTSNDGFDFNPTTLGSLPGQNWIAEAIVSFDSFQTGFRTLIDIHGDTDFRVNNAASGIEALYWDGSTDSPVLSSPLPTTGQLVHYALVWDAAATSLTAYVNGVSIGTTDHGIFESPDATNVSFGYFGRAGFDNRGIDGSLDAVAFSTFTGTFNPSTDFVAAVPEPSTALLAAFGLLGLRRRR